MTEAPATSDVSDALGGQARIAPMQWRRYGGRAAFHGVVTTVRCHEAAGLVRQCIDEPGAGRVLVVDAGGSMAAAVLGDRMAAIALRNGWRGVVIHGAVRDADALARLDFGVFALGTVPRRATFDPVGERDVPVTIDGFTVRPGDHLFCDADGLLACDAGAAVAFLAQDGAVPTATAR